MLPAPDLTTRRTSAENLLLDECEEIVIPLEVRPLEIGIARDAKRVIASHLHAREQRAQIRSDHLLQRNEGKLAARRHPARKRLRSSDARNVLDTALRIVKLHRKSQGKIRDVGERVTGSTARGVSPENLSLEKLVDRLPLGRREIVHSNQLMLAPRAPAAEVVQAVRASRISSPTRS